MRIIPAIDLIDGKCVRLHKGVFESKKVYSEDPVDMARQFADHGIKHLHVVDLDGARRGSVKQLSILEQIASSTDLVIDFGGGIKTDVQVASCLDAGASQITAGSIAATDPGRVYSWIETFGSERIILGADARNGMIAVSGWASTTQIAILDFIDDYTRNGIQYVISTDIDQDGTLEGPSLSLYRSILKRFPDLKIVASGGVGKVEDLYALKELGVEGVIIGKAIYEGNISLSKLAELC